MARLRAELKRGILRKLWRAARDTGLTLNQCLEAFQDNGYDAIQSGRLLISSAGNNLSASFAVPGASTEINQADFFAFSEELFSIRDDTITALTAAGSPTDDESVVASMFNDDRMQTVRGYMGDYSGIRYPTYGVNQ